MVGQTRPIKKKLHRHFSQGSEIANYVAARINLKKSITLVFFFFSMLTDNNSANNTDAWHIRNPCCVKSQFTDPNNIRFKTFGHTANYSMKYLCDQRPDSPYRFMVMGTRNPVDCQLSQPYITYSSKNETIDNMATCGNTEYLGYNRNGRYVRSIYGSDAANDQQFPNPPPFVWQPL